MLTDLSFAEEQLWLEEHSSGAAAPFLDCKPMMSMVARCGEPLNVRALEESLNGIARSHEVLRSRFVAMPGGAARCYEPSIEPVVVQEIDGRELLQADEPDNEAHLLSQVVRAPFDLARPPLIRASLITVSERRHLLAVVVPHIVFDRWSKRVLALDLSERYEAHGCGREVAERPAVQHREYVRQQRSSVEGQAGRALTEYWLRRLDNLADVRLSSDGAVTEASSTHSLTEWLTLPAEDVDVLAALGRRSRATMATLLLTVMKICLHYASGEEDIAVGVPLSDRRSAEFEHAIGLFMNAVVTRTTISDDITVLEAIDRVRRTLVDASMHQNMPYGHLVRVVGRPLFRVIFNFMPAVAASQLVLRNVHLTPIGVETESPSLSDLSIRIRHQSGALVCRFTHKSAPFVPSRIRELVGVFRRLVDAMLRTPDRQIGAICASVAAEMGQGQFATTSSPEPIKS